MFDTERFIEEVERRPALWDPSSEGFANRKKKNQDWQEIAEIILPEWQQLDDSQKAYKGKDLLTKWKNIKDQYRKVLKDNHAIHLQPSSPGAVPKKVRKYVYYDKLHFLRPTIKLDCSFIQTPFAPNEESSSSIPEKDADFSPLSILSVSTCSTSRQDAISENEEINLSEILASNRDEVDLYKDDDYLFCLSLVPLLKRVPEMSRIRTKIDLLKTIDSYVNAKGERTS